MEKNGKSKIIWWLIGAVSAILFSYFNFVISTQAQTDKRQDQSLTNLTESVLRLTSNAEKMLDTFNKVNIIEMNAVVRSIEGRATRIERKLDL